jgi:hypothetical protein
MDMHIMLQVTFRMNSRSLFDMLLSASRCRAAIARVQSCSTEFKRTSGYHDGIHKARQRAIEQFGFRMRRAQRWLLGHLMHVMKCWVAMLKAHSLFSYCWLALAPHCIGLSLTAGIRQVDQAAWRSASFILKRATRGAGSGERGSDRCLAVASGLQIPGFGHR